MPSPWDLELDTDWIRRAADSIQDASGAFSRGDGDGIFAPLSMDGLGPSGAASAVAALVNTRNAQAHAAAAQLQAVAAGVAAGLRDAAAHFDRVEAAVAMPIR